MNESTAYKSVLIFGATGSFGSAITKVMANSGWQVNAHSRKLHDTDTDTNINWVTGDIDQPESRFLVANSIDVIVHAINVPYPQWNPQMVNHTRNIIELAKLANAHLVFVGNIYNFGIPDDGVIRSDTPDAPINELGEIRSTLEQMIKEASANGLSATIMRFGDFFGPSVTQKNWFNESIKNLHKKTLTTMGPIDVPHTWAYLPDAARATERVATARLQSTQLPNFIVMPFHGHVFSFTELKRHIESITGESIKVTTIPWKLFRVLGTVLPLMRHIVSMRYLWHNDIQLDGTALGELVGEPEHTSLKEALLEILASPDDHTVFKGPGYQMKV